MKHEFYTQAGIFQVQTSVIGGSGGSGRYDRAACGDVPRAERWRARGRERLIWKLGR